MSILFRSQVFGVSYVVGVIPALVTEKDIYHGRQCVYSAKARVIRIEVLPSGILATAIRHPSKEDEEQKNDFVGSKGAVEEED